MTKSVIFDCFGVLLTNGWLAFLHEHENSENSDELRYLNIQNDRGNISELEFFQQVSRVTGVSVEMIELQTSQSLVVNQPLISYIHELTERSFDLSIITNIGAPLSDYLPKEIVDLFPVVTESFRVHCIKPDIEIYQLHLNKLGIPASEAIFIDDSNDNCEGAELVGIKSIQFIDNKSLKTQLEGLLK
jgi:HAD superfamily hydrolase (TIGR01509 family)